MAPLVEPDLTGIGQETSRLIDGGQNGCRRVEVDGIPEIFIRVYFHVLKVADEGLMRSDSCHPMVFLKGEVFGFEEVCVMSLSPPEELAKEWEFLEKKALLGLTSREAVGEFLRRWTLAAGSASADDRTLMLSLVNSAGLTLIAQVNAAEAFRDNVREKKRVEQQAAAPVSGAVPTPTRHNAGQWEQEQREARALLKKTQDETREIMRQTAENSSKAADDRNRLMGAMTNPENYCSYCNSAYADTSRGCVHCASFRRV